MRTLWRVPVVLAVLVLSSCSVGEYVAATQHFIAVNVGGANATGDCGGYDFRTNTALLDEACADTRGDPPGWWKVHEWGHGISVRIGTAQAFGTGLVGMERAANCIAFVVTRHQIADPDDVHGYWRCPSWAARITVIRLTAAGITDYTA